MDQRTAVTPRTLHSRRHRLAKRARIHVAMRSSTAGAMVSSSGAYLFGSPLEAYWKRWFNPAIASSVCSRFAVNVSARERTVEGTRILAVRQEKARHHLCDIGPLVSLHRHDRIRACDPLNPMRFRRQGIFCADVKFFDLQRLTFARSPRRFVVSRENIVPHLKDRPPFVVRLSVARHIVSAHAGTIVITIAAATGTRGSVRLYVHAQSSDRTRMPGGMRRTFGGRDVPRRRFDAHLTQPDSVTETSFRQTAVGSGSVPSLRIARYPR